jgi:hypothetical protein
VVATNIAWTDDSTLAGWYSTRTTYNVATGSSNAGAMYSFGVAGVNPVTDRALGGLASGGTGTFYWALKLTNNTGLPIESITVNYNGEQWRDGGAAIPVAQTMDFQYQVAAAGTIVDADSPPTGWTTFSALSFTSPTFSNTAAGVQLDGNAAANRTAKSATVTFGTPVAAGQEIWIRWEDLNDAGNDHGLAIDDLSVTPNGAPAIPQYRSAATGNWNANSTWEQSPDGMSWVAATSTPTSASDLITIRSPHTVTITASVNADQMTIDAGGTVSVNNGQTFTIANGAGTDLTVNPAGVLRTAGNVTNNGQAQIDGTLQIDQGGFPGSGTGTYSYPPTGFLIFNNSSGSFGINNFNFWPAVNGPQLVNVNGSGGITLNVPRSVFNISTKAGISAAGNLTVTGTLSLESGGFVSGSPTYATFATLNYVTGGTYGRAGEWLPGVTSGPGYPYNVTIMGGTTLDLPNSSSGSTFQMAGGLMILAGATLQMAGSTPMTQALTNLGGVINSGTISLSTAPGGDLKLQGNYEEMGTGSVNANAGTVIFQGGASQLITDASGSMSLTRVMIDKSANSASLSSTNLSINGSLTLTAGTLATGASTIFMGPAATLSRTSGFVVGNLQKQFGGPGAFTYAVGTANGYSPVDVTVTAGAGSLTIAANQGPPPVIAPGSSIQRYWTLNGGGVTTNLVFNYLDGDVMGNEANYRIIRISGGEAISFLNNCGAGSPCVNPAANTATINGVQNFSDWTVGESLAPTAAPADLSGHVTATPGGRPFRGIEVSVRNLRTGEVRTTRTDAKGRYVFTGLQTGVDYLVTPVRPGYTFTPGALLISLNSAVSNSDFVVGPEPSLSPARPTGPAEETAPVKEAPSPR